MVIGVYKIKMVIMEILVVITDVGLFFLCSWLLGLLLSKTFDLVEGDKSNVLFILRGGMIILIGIIIRLYWKSL